MKVCYFGNYDPDYPRNRVLFLGLQKNGVEVMECRTRLRGARKFYELFKKHKKLAGRYDVMLVGFSGYSMMWFARLICRKPIVFDAFVSLYLTNVEDRRAYRPKSLRARYYAFLDRFSCRLASLVLLDTQAQIDYFIQRYRLPAGKFVRIFVGADDSVYFPTTHYSPPTPFLVHWHGHIVPFHGLSTVLEAAKMLQNETGIRFRVITRFNSPYQAAKAQAAGRGLNNLEFLPEQSAKQLAVLLNEAEVCLGIFGDNLKARTVIPNKIFEAVACAKPVITARHEGLLELFTSGQNILLVPPSDAGALAQAILKLRSDIELRSRLSRHAAELYHARLTPAVLGKELKDLLTQLT